MVQFNHYEKNVLLLIIPFTHRASWGVFLCRELISKWSALRWDNTNLPTYTEHSFVLDRVRASHSCVEKKTSIEKVACSTIYSNYTTHFHSTSMELSRI